MDNYYMYDASMVFDLAVPIVRKYFCNETIFMLDNGNFKRIRDILSCPEFDALDERIVAAVMSSRTFLKEVDFGCLSFNELKALSLIVNYTNTIYNNQLKYLDKSLSEKRISNKLYSNKRNMILKRIEGLKPYLENIDLYMKIEQNVVDRIK